FDRRFLLCTFACTSDVYTLPLHDALPISIGGLGMNADDEAFFVAHDLGDALFCADIGTIVFGIDGHEIDHVGAAAVLAIDIGGKLAAQDLAVFSDLTVIVRSRLAIPGGEDLGGKRADLVEL